jgi:shikimate dehydrogenase
MVYMKKRFGLIGEKLGHSFSPMIHGYLGDYEYKLYEIVPDSLAAFMSEKNFDGINVTIPYKQAVIPFCSSLSDEARAIGSVNTIIKGEGGLLHGHNTDYFGFCSMLERGNINPGGKKALVLGDGGSARTVRAVLASLRARDVVTISRRGENHYGNIDRHYDADIIVNTTPVGMYPDNGSSPVRLEYFTDLGGVADLIYNPMRTRLLLEAERLGVPCVNGLIMLVAQAEMASRLFMDAPARPHLVADITGLMANKTRNIALIGMPGCGKSTAGLTLAQKTGRQFSDIDCLIEAAAGKPIPQIFSDDGEEAFRRLETRILGDESKKSGAVIATGGGIVTRPENLDLLKQNSIIIYLKRDLGELASEGRPLSQSIGVRELAGKRTHLYEAWSDHTVSVDLAPDVTTHKIMGAIQ